MTIYKIENIEIETVATVLAKDEEQAMDLLNWYPKQCRIISEREINGWVFDVYPARSLAAIDYQSA